MSVKIIADHRETPSNVIRHLKEHDVEIEEKQLNVGDFICSDRVVIERKEVGDFLQSVIDQRLFSQMEKLKECFERPIMIIEGSQERLFFERNIHPNVIRGVLASIAVDYSIPIIWTRNSQETAAQVFWIANREQNLPNREPQIRNSQRLDSLSKQQEYLIAGLPGISNGRARKLLQEFKTPKKIFSAKEEKILKVNGFGEKIAKRIREVLDTEYDNSNNGKNNC